MSEDTKAAASRLVAELLGFARACGAREAGDGAFTVRSQTGVGSEETERNLRAVLREAAARIRELEEALEPFASMASAYFHRYETRPGEYREAHSNDPDHREVYGINGSHMTTGDLRRARAAIRKETP